jgi:helix-turn-helix, Psq domain
MSEICNIECLTDNAEPEPDNQRLQINIQQKKPKQYDKSTLDEALKQIKTGNMSAYKASRLYSVPQSTLSIRLRDLHTSVQQIGHSDCKMLVNVSRK